MILYQKDLFGPSFETEKYTKKKKKKKKSAWLDLKKGTYIVQKTGKIFLPLLLAGFIFLLTSTVFVELLKSLTRYVCV